MGTRIGRRQFLAGTVGGATGLMILPHPRSALSYRANESFNVALVGVAGRACTVAFASLLHAYENMRITALCDVDMRKVAPTYEMWRKRAREWPGSDDENKRRAAEHYQRLAKNHPPLFEDYRRMLDEKGDEIDAVVVATPDHSHAPAAAEAIRAGKPVLAEKPLTITAHEARELRRLAAEYEVPTAMGNQGTGYPGFRRGLEIIREGIIGSVERVHVWFSRGGRNHRQPPRGSAEIPDELNWDLWLGPVSHRPYHPDWIARNHWRETGIGELGNFGPHSANLAFMALRVRDRWDAGAGGEPIRVEAECASRNRLSFPEWERIRWQVPSRGDLPPVTFTWHHGPEPDYAPGSREMLEKIMRDHGATDGDVERLLDYAGAMLVGSEGIAVTDSHNTGVTLLPKKKFEDVQTERPERHSAPHWHAHEWVSACRGGEPSWSSFDYAGPLSEFLTLGDVATQFPEQKLEYDPVAGRVRNRAEADQALSYEHREGWRL